MPPDLALLSTLNGSNYPCLELIFMVPKVFEPLKFDYIFKVFTLKKKQTPKLYKTNSSVLLTVYILYIERKGKISIFNLHHLDQTPHLVYLHLLSVCLQVCYNLPTLPEDL